jgi:hypothetical protein
VLSNDREKIKLEEEVIIEFLVADTDWETGDKTSDAEDDSEEEEEEQQQQKQQQQQASGEVEPQAAISGGLPI